MLNLLELQAVAATSLETILNKSSLVIAKVNSGNFADVLIGVFTLKIYLIKSTWAMILLFWQEVSNYLMFITTNS